MRKHQLPMLENTQKNDTGLVSFTKKAFVFSIIFSTVFAIALNLSLNQVLPDVYSVERLLLKVAETVNTELENNRSRLRLAGFLSRNPYVHYRISVLEENAGRLDRAVEEIELALGLFELSPANNLARDKYQRRLNELNSKRAALSRKS